MRAHDSKRPAGLTIALVLCAAMPAAAEAQPAPGAASAPVGPSAGAVAPTSQPSRLRWLHAPPSAVVALHDVDLKFKLAGPGVPADARVHYRGVRDVAYADVPLGRVAGGYAATIPGERVVAPTLEYYVQAGGAQVFADAARPHRVQVLPAPQDAELQADLEFYRYHRSEVYGGANYVDFGTRDSFHDYFVRSEYSYGYRMLKFVHHIRLGFGLIRGLSPVGDRASPMDEREVGMYYGFAELRFRFHPMVHLDIRPILGATKEGFDGGIYGVFHIGRFTGTQVTAGAEYISTIGDRYWLRLGWRTVPRFPMGITVEIGDFPSHQLDYGLRTVYDVSFAPASWLALTLRVGYEARDSNFGGATAGLTASFSF
ncbi:MAG: hypothetical protein HY906_10225 [Deltaproteobacteria bacterium]|nr:hypothetical protein [Deltaproteobacteria bacterium]